MPDTPPFVLFGVEICTSYSQTVLFRRYSDFNKFHKDLCLFSRFPFRKGNFLDVIPKLPNHKLFLKATSPHVIDKRKKELNEYIDKIMGIYKESEGQPWKELTKTFFELEEIKNKEKRAVRVIEEFYSEYKRRSRKSEIIEFPIPENDPPALESLPDSIRFKILTFLPVGFLRTVSCVSKTFRETSKKILSHWALDEIQRQNIGSSRTFYLISDKLWGLQVLDFKSCQLVDSHCLFSISQNCNPLKLRELSLDECEQIGDSALSCLTSTFIGEKPKTLRYLEEQQKEMAIFRLNKIKIPVHLEGGAWGLKCLSLRNC